MIGAVRRVWDNWRGGGEAAVTVPPMDGALRPNRLIEEARLVARVEAPDNLVSDGERTLYSSGVGVFELDTRSGEGRELKRFDCAVTALSLSNGGGFAAGLDDGRIIIDGQGGRTLSEIAGRRSVCATALLFEPSGALLVAQGSATRRPSEWKFDCMDRGGSGCVARIDLASGKSEIIADRLGWPYGLALTANGGIAVSESWKHRVTVLRGGKAATPVLDDLPGYPARIAPASDGGYWLSIFAPRGQLIEFIQREPEFRKRMMETIDPDHWAAPSLKASSTFLEPLQGGAQKHLGMLKPWAPTRSYGLVVRLDDSFRPTASLHSRADGTRHGVTSAVEVDGEIIVAARGGDVIVAAPIPGPVTAAALEAQAEA